MSETMQDSDTNTTSDIWTSTRSHSTAIGEDEPVRSNGGVRCDMVNGPCSCGAWHGASEPRMMPELPMGWVIFRRQGSDTTVLARNGYVGLTTVATSKENNVEALRNLAWQHARGEDPEWMQFLGQHLPSTLGRDRLSRGAGEGDVKRSWTVNSFPGVLLGMLIDAYTDSAPRPWQALEVDIGDGKKAWLICDANGISLDRLPHHALHGPAFCEWVNKIDQLVHPLPQAPETNPPEPQLNVNIEGSNDVWFSTVVDGRPFVYSSADLMKPTGQVALTVQDGESTWTLTPIIVKRTGDYVYASATIQGPLSLERLNHSWIMCPVEVLDTMMPISVQLSWSGVKTYEPGHVR